MLRCSPWRNYLAATEAVLLFDAEIGKELSSKAAGSTNVDKHTGQSLRQPNMGGLESEGLAPKLLEESEKNLRVVSVLVLFARLTFQHELTHTHTHVCLFLQKKLCS